MDLLRRTRETLFLTDGMLSAYENVPMRTCYAGRIQFAGSGGEMLRGGYARSVPTPTEEKLRAFLRTSFRSHEAYFSASAAAKHAVLLDRWFHEQRRKLSIHSALDKFYLLYRCGRWSAAARAGYTPFQELHQPFFDADLVRTAQLIDVSYRLNDRMIHELLARLAPDVAELPFANDYWRWFSSKQRKQWTSQYPDFYIPREPVVGGTNADWRLTFATQLREEFRRQVFDSSSAAALFEIMDRDRLTQLFDSDQLRDAVYKKFLFNLYSASVLLGNDWIDRTGTARPLEVDPNDF